MVFFFFQAEDGIRDSSVTGVQTCALPILVRTWASHSGAQWRTIVRVALRGYVGRIQHENRPFSTVVESWRGHFYESPTMDPRLTYLEDSNCPSPTCNSRPGFTQT